MNLALALSLLIVLINFIGPGAAAGEHDEHHCNSELLFGDLNQHDERLKAEGLISDRGSMLCGPVCIVNALSYLRATRHLPHVDPVFETDFLVKGVLPEIGVDPEQMIRRGLKAYEFVDLLRAHLAYLGLPAKVTARGVQINEVAGSRKGARFRTPIQLEDLTTNSQQLVVLEYEFWKRKSLRKIFPSRYVEGGWMAAHYVLLRSVRPSAVNPGWYDIEVANPSRGLHQLAIRPVTPMQFQVPVFEVAYPEELKAATLAYRRITLSNVVKIDLR